MSRRLAKTEVPDPVIDLRGGSSRENPSTWTTERTPDSLGTRARRAVMKELRHPMAFLFPLRLFIGIGWLRAFAEKIGDPDWFDGRAVGAFLDAQFATDSIAAPLYGQLVESVLRPGSRWVGWVLMALQLLVGVGILFGNYTNLALLIGIAMNVNFVLAGRTNPSAFYIVIQTVLLVTGSGAVLGMDGKRARKEGRIPSILLVAHPDMRSASKRDKAAVIGLAVLATAVSFFGFAHATDFSPSGVGDPALVLGTVMGLGALSLIILRFRLSTQPS
jgi:thiosulfate dehydrogenase [quinone] large subunit